MCIRDSPSLQAWPPEGPEQRAEQSRAAARAEGPPTPRAPNGAKRPIVRRTAFARTSSQWPQESARRSGLPA
eukprot:13082751-Alexandrium_andersonii.AAC.1